MVMTYVTITILCKYIEHQTSLLLIKIEDIKGTFIIMNLVTNRNEIGFHDKKGIRDQFQLKEHYNSTVSCLKEQIRIQARYSLSKDIGTLVCSFFMNDDHFLEHQLGKLKEVYQNENNIITRVVFMFGRELLVFLELFWNFLIGQLPLNSVTWIPTRRNWNLR